MSTCLYTIEGTLYDKQRDFISTIHTFVLKFDLIAKIEKSKTGYLIEIKADEEELLDFEPQLFKKIASLMEIKLYTKKNPKLSKIDIDNNKPFKTCAQLLRQEKIIAIKGHNCFHLVCSASKSKAVLALRALISQPDKPLSVMYKNIQKARQLILLSTKEETLLTSVNRPFVIAKLRSLHRLEKVKYKHKLTPLINTINQKIMLSLPHNDIYQRLFEQIDFPIVSIDTKIMEKNLLLKTYADKVEYILDSDEAWQEPKAREVLQITYGKTQSIEPTIEMKEKAFKVCLDYEQSTIENFKLKPLKMLEEDDPKYKALSLLFAKLPLEQILTLELSFTAKEIKALHLNWENSTNRSISLLDLFDAIVSLSGELHHKSFINQSVMLVETYYEACEEHLFDYQIVDNEIDIDIISSYLTSNKLKKLGPTLVNTISTIIVQIAKEQNLDVHLNGALFHYRDLSELTIEKLEDEDIKVILS